MTSNDKSASAKSDVVNNNNNSKEKPVTISAASSLDSFIMGLPGAEDGSSIGSMIPPLFTMATDDADAVAEAEAAAAAANDNTTTGSSSDAQQTAALLAAAAGQQQQQQQQQLSSSSNTVSPAIRSQQLQQQPQALPPALLLPPSGQVLGTAATTHTNVSIPEFLYQLTKMLTDSNNDVIEWSHGKIEVHNPHKLESHVLQRYFRHSKFASFQRQLNYFGFRKLAGKGKMAPCSYVNDNVGDDINSLLLIKRKSSATPAIKSVKKKDAPTSKAAQTKKATKKRSSSLSPSSLSEPKVNPVLAGILYRSSQNNNSSSSLPLPEPSTTLEIRQQQQTTGSQSTVQSSIAKSSSDSYKALAQAAVGRGVRHGYSLGGSHTSAAAAGSSTATAEATKALQNASFALEQPSDSLSELANNYRNSLNYGLADDGANATNNNLLLNAEPTPLNEMQQTTSTTSNNNDISQAASAPPQPQFGGFLSRDSSLIDLAMIPPVEEEDTTTITGGGAAAAAAAAAPQSNNDNTEDNAESFGMSFVDFPNPEVRPSS